MIVGKEPSSTIFWVFEIYRTIIEHANHCTNVTWYSIYTNVTRYSTEE